MERSIQICKDTVLEEVSVHTMYAAAKGAAASEEERLSRLGRVPTIDEDGSVLGRFVEECTSELVSRLRGLNPQVTETDENLTLTVGLPGSFDSMLLSGAETSVRKFYVYGLTGRWFMYLSKEESGVYLERAGSFLEDAERKLRYRRSPLNYR